MVAIMPAVIYTVGYEAPTTCDDIVAVIHDLSALLVDCRRGKRARKCRPAVLASRLNGSYYIPDGFCFGNAGKTSGWVWKDDCYGRAETALRFCAQVVDGGRNIVLLCYEHEASECHRTDVAMAIRARCKCHPDVVHLKLNPNQHWEKTNDRDAS